MASQRGEEDSSMANANTPVNTLGAWTVGQLAPTWELSLARTDANGNPSRIMDLTGVTTNQLSMILYTAGKAVATNSPGTGVFTITDVKPGIVTYAQASGDMVTTVAFVRVKINFNGTNPDLSDLIAIVIQN